jgi:hypothetical protein
MKSRTLFSLLFVTIFTSTSVARTHDPQTTQPVTIFSSQMEAERKQLLTRAERGTNMHICGLAHLLNKGGLEKLTFKRR